MSDYAVFADWFINRWDTYAVQDEQGRYKRKYTMYSDKLLKQHLEGNVTLAVDTMSSQGLARWICVDSDAEGGLAELGILQEALADYTLVSLREMSRRGGHLWLLCSAPVLASSLRDIIDKVFLQLWQRQRLTKPVEIYPSSDRPTGPRALTHPVRLPLGVHRVTGQRYSFIGLAGQPLHQPADGLSWLLEQHRNTPHQIEMVLRWLQDEKKAGYGSFPVPEDIAQQKKKAYGIIRWANEEVHLLDVIATMQPAARMQPSGRGYIGWCPWHDDIASSSDGRLGTPSLYVVQDTKYGWSWRCLSTNCGAHNERKMSHTFDWFLWTSAMNFPEAMQLAQEWRERGEAS